VVHLTEILPADDGMGESKRAVEIHLCLAHAVEAGIVVPGPELPPLAEAAVAETPTQSPTSGTKAIVPSSTESNELTRSTKPQDQCPHCGMNWSSFKQAGLMGCPHDYDTFSTKMLPLLKRAQEGATSHIGKVPARRKTPDTEQRIVSQRLRRELQKAIDAENYEEAAQLRDQLRQLEKN
jgi:protein-arginine kinase activator protein McsA